VAEDKDQLEQQDQPAVLCIRRWISRDLPCQTTRSRFLPSRNVWSSLETSKYLRELVR